MDPDCAICSQPALAQCECEAKGLDIAVRQAEQRMMTGILQDIRAWARSHSQDFILSYFSTLTSHRKAHHSSALQNLHTHYLHAYHSRPPPNQIALIDQELKRGIDEDWKSSVQRYPEVLEYFYGLVDLNLPSDSERSVRDPPLSVLGGGNKERERRVRVRESSEVEERRRDRRRRSVGRERVRVDSLGPPPPPPMRVDSIPLERQHHRRERERERDHRGSVIYGSGLPPSVVPGAGYSPRGGEAFMSGGLGLDIGGGGPPPTRSRSIFWGIWRPAA